MTKINIDKHDPPVTVITLKQLAKRDRGTEACYFMSHDPGWKGDNDSIGMLTEYSDVVFLDCGTFYKTHLKDDIWNLSVIPVASVRISTQLERGA